MGIVADAPARASVLAFNEGFGPNTISPCMGCNYCQRRLRKSRTRDFFPTSTFEALNMRSLIRPSAGTPPFRPKAASWEGGRQGPLRDCLGGLDNFTRGARSMGKVHSNLLSQSRRDGSLAFKSYGCRYNSASAQLAAQHLEKHPHIATCARHDPAPCHSHINHHLLAELRNRSG